MFERYNESARRAVFFARYEASQYGSPYVETEHLLLGLMREDRALANRFRTQQGSIESVRKEIEARITISERISTSVEVPLTTECKRALHLAGQESDRLGHRHIGTEHLLLSLLQMEGSLASQVLQARGFTAQEVRESLAKTMFGDYKLRRLAR
jgi:ATP-dependent Clp protease ATP-binding subunit ClpC